MRPAVNPPPQLDRKASRRRREARNTIITYGLVSGLSVALVAALIIKSPDWFAPSQPPNLAVELATASVLFVPTQGDVCRQRTIDNATWRIKDYGPVDCEQALAKSESSQTSGRWSGSRVDIIRDSFRHQP